MTTLVTGASGCLGSHLVERLTAVGERVRVLVRPHSETDFLPTQNVERVVGDLRDAEVIQRAVAGVDVVYHCAARVADRGEWKDFDACNIQALERLLAATTDAGVARFIHVSSVGIYPPTPPTSAENDGQHRITEADGYDPYPWRRGFYTWSKMEADRVALRYGRKHDAPAVIVMRPGILYGPRAKPFTARLHFSWRDKLTLIVGKREAVLPLTHIGSIVDALLLAGHGLGKSGEAYNIVDRPISQQQYLDWLSAANPNSPRVVYIPFSWVYALASLVDRLARGRFRTLRYKLLRAGQSIVHDTTKAEQDLGWTPAEELVETAR